MAINNTYMIIHENTCAYYQVRKQWPDEQVARCACGRRVSHFGHSTGLSSTMHSTLRCAAFDLAASSTKLCAQNMPVVS